MGTSVAKPRLSNLPLDATSFVGRRHELREVKRLLTTTRLLTLTGPGGVGKTRLALTAAAELARGFPDGVWFAPLASVQDPMLVIQAVFTALGGRDQSPGWSLVTLTDFLAERRALLVLDNCEHVLEPAATLVSTVLRGCPNLKVLVTSRAALGVAGELRLAVPPLSLPSDANEASIEHVASSEAVALLIERAASVLPGFAVNRENAAAVLRLCRRLDGIPLALELAAVRLGALSLDQLNDGLAKELSALGIGNRGADVRQQTLEATIGWSYQLLDVVEQLLWARLSTFAGGFDATAALQVCCDDQIPAERLVELLGALVEKSIVRRELRSGNEPRYWLLDTIRQYGKERLRDVGEQKTGQARHLAWVADLASAIGAFDARQRDMFRRMDAERDNLWAALEFALTDDAAASQAANSAQHLIAYWTSRGQTGDVRRVLTALAERSPERSVERAQFLLAAAVMANTQNDFEASGTLGRESVRIATDLDAPEVIALALAWLGIPLAVTGHLTDGIEAAESAIARAALLNSRPIHLIATAVLCNILQIAGQPEMAIEYGERALGVSQDAGELWTRGYLLMATAQARWRQGDREFAESQALAGALAKHALDDRAGLIALLEILGWMAAHGEDPRRTATLLGCAQRIRESSAIPFQEGMRPQHDQAVALALEALGQKQYQAIYDGALARTIDEATAIALGEEVQRRRIVAKSESELRLTKREMEIVRLIAQDMTSREIAGALFISERTVETHVTNMLNKLGLNSRVQLTRWLGDVERAGLPVSTDTH